MSEGALARPGTAPAAAGDDLLTRWRRRYLRSEGIRGWCLSAPALFVVIAALAVPIGLLVLFSFWTQDYVHIDTSLTLHNYQLIARRTVYLEVFLRSVAISGLVTLMTVTLAYPLAYYVAFDVTRKKMVWLILITLPFWTSYLLRVFAWKIILGYGGVVNSGLQWLGLIEEPLSFLLYNPFAVILTLAHAWAAFAILPIYVSLEKIDRSLLEAATDLGDGPIERFWRVTFPLSMPGVIAAAIVIFIPTVGDYVTPALVGGPSGLMIANLIQTQFSKANDWPLGAALSIASMVTVTLIACLFVWFSKKATARIA
ncbi:spermidine/putrescine transport system permease protein [Tistlia consotensis]|uniref:Spermidine/putrescine transport system permease protein n=1 Tax=Tistlia consotensis USBA 355 TaxID=560819 RepID=A0A1Y6BIV4_9PROT|nr:ABC transporter permease [Tistlia consotensis]SMF13735.1 spermidine/putrescine transport system permease protein [Tistlia consotensis USBA 355]SNR50246.1 spermidine/putrescine transport system permease protein [Tistlia consotensis]